MNKFTLEDLEQIIAKRIAAADGSSYTASLAMKGVPYAVRKLGEESFETAIAALCEDKNRLISESADLVYHLMVIWKIRDIKFEDVLNELAKRTTQSGLQEKAARQDG